MRTLWTLFTVASAGLAMLACDPRSATQSFQVVDLELVREIAPRDSGEMIVVSDVIALSDSTVAVVSSEGTHFGILSWTAQDIRHAGRRGKGPGEFVGLHRIVEIDQGRVAAIDPVQMRVSIWDAQGAWLRDIAVPIVPIVGAWYTDMGLVVRTGSAAKKKLQFIAINLERGEQNTLLSVPISLSMLDSDLSCSFCEAAMSRAGSFALAVADTSYRILRYDSRGRAMSSVYRKGLPLASLTGAERKVVEDRWRKAQEELGSIKAFDKIPDFKKQFAEFGSRQIYRRRFLPMGTRYVGDELWIQRDIGPADSAVVDVFDHNGRFLNEIRLPSMTRITSVRGNNVIAVRDTSEGLSVVAEYRIVHRTKSRVK